MDNKEQKDIQKAKLDKAKNTPENGEFTESIKQIKSDVEIPVPESPREVVDDNIDFGAMSNEIASKVKANIPEENLVEESRIDSVMSEVENRGSTEKFDEFLEDIGITRQQFYIFLTIVLVFLLGVFISFYYLLSWFATGPTDINQDLTDPVVVEEEFVDVDKPSLLQRLGLWWDGLFPEKVDVEELIDETPDVPVTDVEEPLEQVENNTKIEGIDLNSLVGNQRPVNINTQAVELGFLIGTAQKQENKLSEYVRIYRELRAVFNTDLFAYLSVVDDRTKGFEEYLTRFKGVNQKMLLSREDLLFEIAEYRGRLQAVEAELIVLEGSFFGELEALNSEVLPSLLAAFQEVGKRQVVINSELKARQSVLDRYNSATGIVADRIQAIELNRDAFVKGVQVVDYKNIDLDLIRRQ